jgi:nicotinamidase/pyrazinamidase
MNEHALVLVDIQNDFLPGGALEVKEGDQVVPIANRLMDDFGTIVATQDWHPAGHGSFAVNHAGRKVGDIIPLHGVEQILWPAHCVQGTPGADFAPGLDVARITRIFRKGTDPGIDSYSGFYDNGHRRSTGLGEWLHGQGVRRVTVCGLATDYCVKFTALDAIAEGFEVALHLPACRGVNLHARDVDRAVEEMREKGVAIEG